MTTPPVAPPAVSRGAFNGSLFPPDVQGAILSMIADSAPFSNSITRRPTSSPSVIFPLAAPDGAAWIGELDRIPLMNLHDEAYEIAVAKLAGLLDISSESISDSSLNLSNQLRDLIAASLSPQLDEGLLFGSGGKEPVGVVATADAVAGASLFAAANAAKGEIADSGGTASVIAASGAAFAAADGATATDGQLLYPGGVAAALSLTPVTVPGLDPALVYDPARLFLILNGELSSVDYSADFRFDYDAITLRVKSRVACACPDPNRALRSLEIDGNGNGRARQHQAKASSGKASAKAA